MPAASKPPHLLTLILVTALAVLSLNLFLPSLARIAEDFSVTYAQVNLALGGYLALSALLQLVMGPLSDRFGRRPVMLASMAVFALASIGCVLAESFWTFLAFRLLQGMVVAGQVVSRAAIRDMYSTKEAASKLGYVTMAMALAPRIRVNAIGPGPTLRNERQSEEDFAEQCRGVPLRRATGVDEICHAVRFLAEAPAMTGQMLALDGGEHLGWAQPVNGFTPRE